MTLVHALKLSSQALYLDPEGSAPAMFLEFIWCSDLLRCMPLLALAASDSLSDAPICRLFNKQGSRKEETASVEPTKLHYNMVPLELRLEITMAVEKAARASYGENNVW